MSNVISFEKPQNGEVFKHKEPESVYYQDLQTVDDSVNAIFANVDVMFQIAYRNASHVNLFQVEACMFILEALREILKQGVKHDS